MKNWSQNQYWQPKVFLQPSSSDEIQDIVKKSVKNQQKIRVYGSKHSFTALNNTDDICLNLDNYKGLISVDPTTNYVTVKSGTKLFNLTQILAENDLALENMGDIDKQSIAGAISTGTHGTGIDLGNISTQIFAIKFINGLGDEVYCSETENKPLFKCLQLSLGVFGVITEITLKCVKNYKLKLEKKGEYLDRILNNLQQLNTTHRNFEFYWLPYTNKVQTKYGNISTKKANKDNFINYFNDVILENYTFKMLCNIAKVFPTLNVGISKFSSIFLSNSIKIKENKDVYATPRLVKFNEMEYNVPLEAYKDCFNDIKKLVNSKKFAIHFPIENRFVQKDNIYLSPAYKRNSAYIACHVYKGKDFINYFKALEEIFTAYNGRPHWGKMHYKKSDYFSKEYEMFTHFNSLRLQQDPHSVFLTPYFKSILEI